MKNYPKAPNTFSPPVRSEWELLTVSGGPHPAPSAGEPREQRGAKALSWVWSPFQPRQWVPAGNSEQGLRLGDHHAALCSVYTVHRPPSL